MAVQILQKLGCFLEVSPSVVVLDVSLALKIRIAVVTGKDGEGNKAQHFGLLTYLFCWESKGIYSRLVLFLICKGPC